jgi:hypothetical protein
MALLPKSTRRKLATAAVMSVGAGGSVTTAVPGLSHWPPPAVAVAVALVVASAGLLRRLLTVALISVGATLALVAADAITDGRLREVLSFGSMLSRAHV